MAAAMVVVAVVLAAEVARLGTAAVARARAESAADAAALAAATALARGESPEQARAAAADTARGNGARLARCVCAGRRADVTVTLGNRLRGGVVASASAEIGRLCPLCPLSGEISGSRDGVNGPGGRGTRSEIPEHFLRHSHPIRTFHG
jgi:secretion/DNA translocation related TadE-like protein